MVRAPAVAGSFYAATKEELEKQIKKCFSSKVGPGTGKKTGKKLPPLLAGVSPHAGYAYSGPVAAHLFDRIKNSKPASTYIIIGPNHSGIGTSISTYTEDAWATPLGQVEIDLETANALVEDSGLIDSEKTAHLYEHSVEVQLPFLQHVLSKKFKIVPICMMRQDPVTAEDIGRSIFNVCKDKNVTVIASSDFTHYEPAPVAEKKDMEAIDGICALDMFSFFDALRRNQMSVCGYGPIAVAMTYAAKMGAEKGTLLKYATSGDATKDKTSVVGYASIAFE